MRAAPGFRVWDVATEREQLLEGVCTTQAALPCVAWSRTDLIAAGSLDGTVWVWSRNPMRFVTRFAVNPTSADVLHRLPEVGRLLVAPSALERLDGVTTLAFSADGGKLVVATRSGIVQLVDTADWENRAVLSSEAKDVACLAFSPSGSRLVANQRGQLLCWSLSDLAQISGPRRFGAMHDSPIASVLFRHDGQTLAVGRHDGTVQFFTARFLDIDRAESAHSEAQLVLTGHLDRVAAMCFSPDDRTLATGSWDATVRLWHVASGQDLAVLRGHHDKVEAVVFSPDGSVLASGGHRNADRGEVFLWKAACPAEGSLPPASPQALHMPR